MIHKKQYKDSVTGEIKTRYTSDREDCKVVMVNGKPIERQMNMDERRKRRDGQKVGKTKQRGITKQHKKLERQRKERMEKSKDIEERLGEFVSKVLESDTENKLKFTKSKDIVASINNYIAEKEEEEDDEDEDTEKDVEISSNPEKDLEKLDPEEKEKVKGMMNTIKKKGVSLDDEGDDSEDDVETDDSEDDVEDTEDETQDDEPEETDDVEDDSEEGDEETDDSDDSEDDDGELVDPSTDDDSDDSEEGEPEEPESTDGNMNDPEDSDDSEENEDELDADNEVAELTKEHEYDIDTNNAYDFYDFLLKTLNDEGLISKVNGAYSKIPKDKRKLTVGRELLKNINDVIDSAESSASPFGGDDEGGFGGSGDEGGF